MPSMAACSYGILEQEASMIHLLSAHTEKTQARQPAPGRRTLRSLATGIGLCLTVALLSGCGTSMGASSALAPQSHSVGSNDGSSSNTTSGGSTTTTSATPGSQNSGPPYLVKSLQVTIQVKDTRAAAGTILAWIM